MNIGVIGSGQVGGTLGRRWAGAGHRVCLGFRDLASPRAASAAGPNARAVSLAEAWAQDVLLLALPWGAVREALAQAPSLKGKILLDATNPLREDFSGLALGQDISGAEKVAEWAAGARVVKAFNTTGYNVMENPDFGGAAASLFYCGDDAAAKTAVRELIGALGFDPVDAGPLAQARLLEPLAMLWISLAMKQGLGRDIAFRLMRR